MKRTVLIVFVYIIAVFLGIFLGAVLGIKNAYPQQPARRPPEEKPVVIDLPYVPPESDFFSGGIATYSGEGPRGERPVWSSFGRRPLIIGLKKGRDWQPREIVIEEELRRFALKFTRNVLVIHASPWEAKEKFKKIAADPRYCWVWLDADIDSLSLAWFHCFDLLCFEGSQARLSIIAVEINPNNNGEEFLILASTSHFIGHIHSWARRLWIEAGSSENFYFFTARMLLRAQLSDFEQDFKKKLAK